MIRPDTYTKLEFQLFAYFFLNWAHLIHFDNKINSEIVKKNGSLHVLGIEFRKLLSENGITYFRMKFHVLGITFFLLNKSRQSFIYLTDSL